MKTFFGALTFDSSGIRPFVNRPALPIIAILCQCFTRGKKRASSSQTYKKESFLKVLFYSDMDVWKRDLKEIIDGARIPETNFLTLSQMIELSGLQTSTVSTAIIELLREEKIETQQSYRKGITMRYRLTDAGVRCAVCLTIPKGIAEPPCWR